VRQAQRFDRAGINLCRTNSPDIRLTVTNLVSQRKRTSSGNV
jgi:hypothetical protein